MICNYLFCRVSCEKGPIYKHHLRQARPGSLVQAFTNPTRREFGLLWNNKQCWTSLSHCQDSGPIHRCYLSGKIPRSSEEKLETGIEQSKLHQSYCSLNNSDVDSSFATVLVTSSELFPLFQRVFGIPKLIFGPTTLASTVETQRSWVRKRPTNANTCLTNTCPIR